MKFCHLIATFLLTNTDTSEISPSIVCPVVVSVVAMDTQHTTVACFIVSMLLAAVGNVQFASAVS